MNKRSIHCKLKIAFILVTLSIFVCGCGATNKNKEQLASSNGSVEVNYRTLDNFDNALNFVINNSLSNEDNINDIADVTSESVRKSILNKEYNNNSEAVANQIYVFDGCVFVQTRYNNINYMYKLQVVDNKLNDCVIYELYE